jgi:hypothetical protein
VTGEVASGEQRRAARNGDGGESAGARGASDPGRQTHGAHEDRGGSGVWIAPDHRLVVLVASASGGVGRSSVAALLAAALHAHCVVAPIERRATAVLDCAARGQSPWPAWVAEPAGAGTATLAAYRGTLAGAQTDLTALAESASSAFPIEAAGTGAPGAAPAPPANASGTGALRVFTDTGPASPTFLGADPGPRWWLPLLPGLRTAVVDGDALEGARLAVQAAGGPLSSIASWLGTPFVSFAVVWVTDTADQSLQRALDALDCMARTRIRADRVVVAVTDRRARRHTAGCLPVSWGELIRARAGAVVELGYDRAVAERSGPPRLDAAALARPHVLALAAAVAEAARLPWLADGEEAPGEAVGAGAAMSELILRQAARSAMH